MIKLIKYDAKRCLLPFLALSALELMLLLLSLGGVKDTNAYHGVSYQIGSIILLIHGGIVVYKDFCSEENILANTVPISIVKRFFSKFAVLTLGYIILQLCRLLYEVLSPDSGLMVLRVTAINFSSYALYDFIGGIIFYSSSIAAIAFGLILVNSVLKNKAFIPLLNVVVIFAIVWGCMKINQGYETDPMNTSIKFEFKSVQMAKEGMRYEFRKNYAPFNFTVNSEGYHSDWVDAINVGYSYEGAVFGIGVAVGASLLASVLLRQKGINR